MEQGSIDVGKKEEVKPMQSPIQKEDPKSEKRSSVIIIGSILLIIVIIGSFILFQNKEEPRALTLDELFLEVLNGNINDDTGYLYTGFAFVNAQDTWFTRIRLDDDIIQIPLHYGARDIEDIPVEGKLNEVFKQRNIYITFDTNSTGMQYVALSAAELSLNLAKGINAVPIAACTSDEDPSCEGRPILTCENTTVPIIYLKQAEEEKVLLEGNCITVQGKDTGLVEAVDRFLLLIYGIMQV